MASIYQLFQQGHLKIRRPEWNEASYLELYGAEDNISPLVTLHDPAVLGRETKDILLDTYKGPDSEGWEPWVERVRVLMEAGAMTTVDEAEALLVQVKDFWPSAEVTVYPSMHQYGWQLAITMPMSDGRRHTWGVGNQADWEVLKRQVLEGRYLGWTVGSMREQYDREAKAGPQYAKFWRNGVAAISHVVCSKEVIDRYPDHSPRRTMVTFECGRVVLQGKLKMGEGWHGDACPKCVKARKKRLEAEEGQRLTAMIMAEEGK